MGSAAQTPQAQVVLSGSPAAETASQGSLHILQGSIAELDESLKLGMLRTLDPTSSSLPSSEDDAVAIALPKSGWFCTSAALTEAGDATAAGPPKDPGRNEE